MTDKTKAQIEFAKQAVKDALDRTELELFAANEAVHKVVELESKDDPDEFRVMVMGRLVDQLGYMCTPQIKLLGDIAVVLHGFETEEKREGEPVVSRH